MNGVQGVEMNHPRSWNRREFRVAANGFFTVLRPTGWFSAVPLPGGFRYLVNLSKRSVYRRTLDGPGPELNARGHANGQEVVVLSQSRIPGAFDHHFMRSLIMAVLTVLAAVALSFLLLWFSGDCSDIRDFLVS